MDGFRYLLVFLLPTSVLRFIARFGRFLGLGVLLFAAVSCARHVRQPAATRVIQRCMPGTDYDSGWCVGSLTYIQPRQEWTEYRFRTLDEAVAWFSQPGNSSTAYPRAYLSKFQQPDGSVIIRTVP